MGKIDLTVFFEKLDVLELRDVIAQANAIHALKEYKYETHIGSSPISRDLKTLITKARHEFWHSRKITSFSYWSDLATIKRSIIEEEIRPSGMTKLRIAKALDEAEVELTKRGIRFYPEEMEI